MISREQIGVRLKALRKKAGLSQKELSEKLHISAQAVSKWEIGKNLPDIDLLYELSGLFGVTFDSLVGSSLSSLPREKVSLPKGVLSVLKNRETQNLLTALAPFCTEQELTAMAKELTSGQSALSLAATIQKAGYSDPVSVEIPVELFGETALYELAPYFAEAIGKTYQGIDPALRRASDYLCCPVCSGNLSLKQTEENAFFFSCACGRRYDVVDGVIDFGSREKEGERWSDYFRNYASYQEDQRRSKNPRYEMGEIPSGEVRWRRLRELKPRVMVDIACGTCTGVSYDLKRINWPCTLILTDLSHRVQKYNRLWFSEEAVNPYVDILYLACDCAHLPIRSDCIDIILSHFGIESMREDMLKGMGESFRVLKPGGHALYNMNVVEDHSSKDTQKWISLYRTLPWAADNAIYDIREWETQCREIGFVSTASTRIYGELPAPDTDVFPFSNEVLQWMAEIQCDSIK